MKFGLFSSNQSERRFTPIREAITFIDHAAKHKFDRSKQSNVEDESIAIIENKMPFLGQDWRSPGEQWVRTTEGWERLKMWRLKLLENLNENVIARFMKLMESELGCFDKEMEMTDCHCPQPHVYVIKGTREQKMQTSIGEAFSRLDMSGAVKDHRRFNYVCKLTELLIKFKLCSLSGTAQKHLFNILEEILSQVLRSKNNIHIMQKMLADLRLGLQMGEYNHVGSSSLWQKHMAMVNRMQGQINNMEISEREDDGKVTLGELPDDCIREILVRLSDHKDIVNTGLTDSRTYDLALEKCVWKDLCLFHFDNQQIQSVFRKGEQWNLEELTTDRWKILYLRLFKRYGKKDMYAEMLYLCKHCNAIYWQHHGHPCLVSNVKPKSVPISPVMCVELFTA